ncbi:MAG: B12-binding domain-containing radical SAM protein, partial [Candidatus Anammoxibacter sp.]
MNILFIYPNINAQVGFNYGVASISAVLKQSGHQTKLINLNEKLGDVPDDKQIIDTIKSFKPGLIGFSVVTPQYKYALKIAKLIKASCNIPIVCGGIHATIAADEVLLEDCFDYACIGEGEYSMLELVSDIENGKKPLTIAGIWAKADNEIIKNPVKPFIDINKLPRKDYEIFDLQNMINVETGWVRMMASRGCPFRCTYCLNHQVVNLYKEDTGLSQSKLNYTRRQNVDDVLSEIDFLLNNYKGINTIIFDDDIFTLDMKFLRDFCVNYKKVSNLPFVVNAHVRVFNEERAKLLKDAGCAIVKFGVESGSEKIRRDILHRPMSNKEIIDSFAIAHKYGFHTSAFLLLGLPHETKEDIMDTIKLLREVKPGRFRWSLFYPFPKTTAYDISLKGGYINFEKMESLSNFTDESCLDFGPEHNLFVAKMKKVLPWYVNMGMDANVSEIFTNLIKKVEPLSN